MNRNTEPTINSIVASEWFQRYLNNKLTKKGDDTKLAKALGMERKSIYAYKSGAISPKLEIVAKILAYYGEKEIRIPLEV